MSRCSSSLLFSFLHTISYIMVGRQIISSPIFNAKGKLSTTMKRNLLVRGGGGLQVRDCLSRFGWDGTKPVVSSILSLDPDSGVVRGARFGTWGEGPVVKFKAGELWGGVTEDISFAVNFSDLSVLEWKTTGEERNQTVWMDRMVLF